MIKEGVNSLRGYVNTSQILNVNTSQIFQKLKKEKKSPNSFYWVSINLIPKTIKDMTRKNNKNLHDIIPDEYRYKNSQKTISKLNSKSH